MEQNNDVHPLIKVIASSGEVGKYICEQDWSHSPLGDMSQWSPTLLQYLSNILMRKIPAFMYWGPHHLCFYNDSFIPSLGVTGKHPSMLGKPAQEAWGEIYDDIVKDIKNVYQNAASTMYVNRKLPIFRNDKIEDAYWTYGHSPIYGPEGNIEGVHISLVETTSQLTELEALSLSNAKIVNLIAKAPFAMCYINGKNLIFEIVNENYLALIQRTEDEVVNKNIYEVLPEVRANLEEILDNVRLRGIQFEASEFPVELIKQGIPTLGYYDFVYHPVYNQQEGHYDILVIAFEVTEAKVNKDLVIASEQRYKLLADSMPQIVWIADKNGVVNYWNEVTFDFTGLTYQQLRSGIEWLQVIHPDDAENNVKVWMHSVNTGTPYLIEHRFRDRHGNYKWMMSRALPYKDAEGNIEMWIGTSTDIDDKKELEIHKDEFIKMANHELKTPITTLKGYAQLLTKNSEHIEDPITKMSLKAVNSQVLKLEKLIDDMLDLSRIETGNLPINIGSHDILQILEECIADIKVIHKNINIQMEYDKAGTYCSAVDADRIRQVFYNILTNAIKYAPNSNTIDILASQEGNTVTISIQDYGIGIEETFIPKLFERFYRVPGESEQKYAGFGIGLFLVKEIIEKHNGTISVESKLGAGTKFIISLPLCS